MTSPPSILANFRVMANPSPGVTVAWGRRGRDLPEFLEQIADLRRCDADAGIADDKLHCVRGAILYFQHNLAMVGKLCRIFNQV
ncbi:MAG: hypothetical protein V3R65_06935 [Acidiferrobacterales bacterium]